MVIGFKTRSGSEYSIDLLGKTISGGNLREPMNYEKGFIIPGLRAVFTDRNENTLRTSEVSELIKT